MNDANDRNPQASAGEVARLSTGIAGLDEILGGGLPERRLYLLQGGPGTGKSTLALQFLLAGAARGESVLYVSLSQSAGELEQMAASHGWDTSGVVIAEIEASEQLESAVDQTIFHTADIKLDSTRDAIERLIDEHKPTRIVYDSLIEIRNIAGDPLRYRRELLGFKKYLAEHAAAAVLIDTVSGYGGDLQVEGLAHGMLRLDKELPEYGVARRRLEVKKMRGLRFADGYHDMAIRTGGVEVFPRVVPSIAPEARQTELIKCDMEGLDSMLGGGLEAGTTTLIVGQSGTGKSTLASLYAKAALERGEGVALFLFEERVETFFRRCDGLGIDLREHAETGRLVITDFSPAEISPGEFSQIAQHAVDKRDVKVVLIDSFTGYVSALPQSEEAVTQIHTLLKYLARRGVLTILIVAQHGLLGQNTGTPVDVSFLGDAVLLLRMFEWPGLIRRSITVVKKRHGPHDMNMHELVIEPGGVTLQDFNPPPQGPVGPIPNASN